MSKITKWFDGEKPQGAEMKVFITYESLRPVLSEAFYINTLTEKIACMEFNEKGVSVIIRNRDD